MALVTFVCLGLIFVLLINQPTDEKQKSKKKQKNMLKQPISVLLSGKSPWHYSRAECLGHVCSTSGRGQQPRK